MAPTTSHVQADTPMNEDPGFSEARCLPSAGACRSAHTDEHHLPVPGGAPPPSGSLDPACPQETTDFAEQAEREASFEQVVNAGIERILAAFEAKLAYDTAKQAQIDRLHDEVTQHRRDLVAHTARPLIHGLIRIHDDIGRLLTALRAKPHDELTPVRFFSLLEGFQEDVEIVLDQNGVKTYRMPAGHFDPRRQKLLEKVETTDEALAGVVAQSIRPGFEQGETLLEKERVSAYALALPSITDTREAEESPRAPSLR